MYPSYEWKRYNFILSNRVFLDKLQIAQHSQEYTRQAAGSLRNMNFKTNWQRTLWQAQIRMIPGLGLHICKSFCLCLGHAGCQFSKRTDALSSKKVKNRKEDPYMWQEVSKRHTPHMYIFQSSLFSKGQVKLSKTYMSCTHYHRWGWTTKIAVHGSQSTTNVQMCPNEPWIC